MRAPKYLPLLLILFALPVLVGCVGQTEVSCGSRTPRNGLVVQITTEGPGESTFIENCDLDAGALKVSAPGGTTVMVKLILVNADKSQFSFAGVQYTGKEDFVNLAPGAEAKFFQDEDFILEIFGNAGRGG